MKSPMHVLRDLRKPKTDRREARRLRETEKHRDEAERLAARSAGEANRWQSKGYTGG